MMVQLINRFMKGVVRNPSQTLRVLLLMLAVCAYGTTGFLYFELPDNPDLTWGDGLWFTLVTMATVGYGDFFPKSVGGRFLIGGPIMILGIGLLGYALSLVAAALVTSKTQEVRGMSAFSYSDHLVIFNFPGEAKILKILDELAVDPAFGHHRPIVLVDENLEELPAVLQKHGLHYVRGNPTRDDTLDRVALDQASHALVLCRPGGDAAADHLNVAIALAVEARCPRVTTVVECADPASEELLRKAGCDRVVCTARFDSLFLSQEIRNPGAQEVVADLFSAESGQQLHFTPVHRGAPFRELAQRCRTMGHLALGVATADAVTLNLPDDRMVESGMHLVTIGPAKLAAL